jgi:hypothetical protein
MATTSLLRTEPLPNWPRLSPVLGAASQTRNPAANGTTWIVPFVPVTPDIRTWVHVPGLVQSVSTVHALVASLEQTAAPALSLLIVSV